MQTPFILGLTGGSASGKTRFLTELLAHFTPGQVCLMSLDDYYRPIGDVELDANGVHNFDDPRAIDADAYRADVLRVQAGETVQKLEYTFNNPSVVPKMLTYACAPIVLLEGIFVFYYPQVRDLIDLKVFIDATEPVKLRRRIVRDALERGYDLQDVLYRYEHHVAPTYRHFVEPLKDEADIVIPNNTGFDKGLQVLLAYLERLM